jgi:hypothetical protein
MRARSKLLLAGLATTVFLSLAVSSASANRLSLTNPRIRVTWTALRAIDEVGNTRVSCPVTIEGSFHSATIRKVEAALVGYITRAEVRSASCSGGKANILNASLPWHMTYDKFEGVLPSITSIWLLLHNIAFEVEVFFQRCLYQGNAENRARLRVEVTPTRQAPTLTIDEEIRLPRRSGGNLCAIEIGFDGTGQVFLQGTVGRISVTLI